MSISEALTRIWPFLHQYFKTNYFTGILLLVLAAIFLAGHFGRGRFLVPSPKKAALWLAVFCLIGAGLRLAWIPLSHHKPAFYWSDSQEKSINFSENDFIHIYAVAIPKGVWFRDAEGKPLVRRPIGYPMLLGAAYSVFGASLPVFYSLNLLLFFCTAVLIYLLGTHLFDRDVGLIAAAAFCLYPVSIYTFSIATDEHLFLPIWYLGLYLLLRHAKGTPVKWAPLWYGLIFGYATMTRTHSVFMPLVVGYVYFFISKASWKKALGALLLVFVMGHLLALPWALRNYRHWGVYIPYTAANADLHLGMSASVDSADRTDHYPQKGEDGYNEELTRAYSEYDVPKMERLAKEEMVRYVMRHPTHFVMLGIQKWLYFMGTNRQSGVWPIDMMEESKKMLPQLRLAEPLKHAAQELAFAFYYVAFYLFLFGIFWLCRSWRSLEKSKRDRLSVILLCFAFYMAEHFIIFPQRKYRFPLEPFMFMLGAAFLLSLLRRGSSKTGSKEVR